MGGRENATVSSDALENGSMGDAGQGQPPPHGHRRLIGMAVSVATLAASIVWASRQDAPELPTSASSLLCLGAALAVYLCALGLRGFRWKAILDRAGVPLENLDPYAICTIGYMGNIVLPFRGGEALRIVLVRQRAHVPWGVAVGSVVPERILDAFTLGALFAAFAFSAAVETPGGRAAAVAALLATIGIAAAGFVAHRARGLPRLEPLAARLRPFAQASRPLLTPAALWLVALSLLISALDGIVFWLIAESLSLPLNPIDGIGLAVVAAAASLVPAGPAFAGTLDLALLVSLGALGVNSGPAISFAILLRFVVFVPVTAIGLLLAAFRYGGLGMLTGRGTIPPVAFREQSSTEPALTAARTSRTPGSSPNP